MFIKTLKLLLPFIFVIATWMLVVPIFEFPDEQAHFGTISFLIQNNRLPRGEERDLSIELEQTERLIGTFRDPLGNNKFTYHPEYHSEYSSTFFGPSESAIFALNNSLNRTTYIGVEAARYPPLYYYLLSGATRSVNNEDIITRLFITRLGGLVLALSLAYAAYLLGLEIFSHTSYAYALSALIILQPMVSFVTAGINSDNLHNVLFTLILTLSLRLLKNGVTWTTLGSLAFVTLLDFLTKPQGYLALPIILLSVLLNLIARRQWKAILLLLFLSSLVLVVARPLWYEYLFGVNIRQTSFIEYVQFSANKLLAQNTVWYWGVFKWLGVVLPPIYWRIANRAVLLSVVGLVVYSFKAFRRRKILSSPLIVGYLFLCSIVYAGAIFWFDWQYVKLHGYSLGIQARYFFPTISAHLSLLMIGILSLSWNSKVTNWLKRSLILLFLWLQLGGIWRLISIYYDTSSLTTFIVELSQYKPFFAKGDWWYLWFTLYFGSLAYMLKKLWPAHKSLES